MEMIAPRAAERQVRRAGAWRGTRSLLHLALSMVALLARIPLSSQIENPGNAEVVQAVSLSLTTTALNTSAVLLFGTPLAYLLSRRTFCKHTVIDLPMVLPPSVASSALLIAFGRRGLLGAYLATLGLSLAFTQTAVVLAQIFVAAPF